MCASCAGLAAEVADKCADDTPSKRIELSVPSMACGGCVAKIERSLNEWPNISKARANLTLKRLIVEGNDDLETPDVTDHLKSLSFDAFEIEQSGDAEDEQHRQSKFLLRAMAVAGFGSANIMLLSVSTWSGAETVTRDLFHLISAIIAVPVVAYSGQPFFRSALRAVRFGRVNMDVPISLAVLLALGMSIFQTMTGKPEAYFDAAVMLLFFLLIGRYLDQLMRARARSAVVSLSEYAVKEAVLVFSDGETKLISSSAIEEAMILRLYAGSRVPADCTIVSGRTDVDRSMVTGESDAVALAEGAQLEAGTLNLTGSIDVRVDKNPEQSFLAEVSRMLDAAEQGKGHYVRIADRMARIYTPAVHTFALAAFIGWMFVTGGDWQTSLLIAISVLIVTCPCALALAVPVAHVISASRLFKHGLLMRDGSALERLAEIDTVVFDKTGTVTTGIKQVEKCEGLNDRHSDAIATLAEHSSHPSAMGIRQYFGAGTPVELKHIKETPGLGISAMWNAKEVRLGDSDWVAEIASAKGSTSTCFAVAGEKAVSFYYREFLRGGVDTALEQLNAANIPSEILSGDAKPAVDAIATGLPFASAFSGQTPDMKLEHVKQLIEQNHKPLMVGDGINDAPALAAAHVSLAPSSAADVGRQAADFVLAREDISVLPLAWRIAKRTDRIVRQNFILALAYNCVAVPLALMGVVTPLVAAIAMSASSLVVITNSLRLMKDPQIPRTKNAQSQHGTRALVAA